jgi:hypothetical protein
MATGDITACRILSTGWEAEIDIAGLAVGGAYVMDGGASPATLTEEATATVVFTVVSEGYNAAGVPGTKTRTVYGSRPRMKAYPDHEEAEEAVNAGTLTLTLALSEYIYADDKAGGAGTSGTNPTVTIAAGFYTEAAGDGGTANNAVTALAVTNNSAELYPKVIARWATVPYQRVVTTLGLEVVAFHRFAEHGKPVACVIFTGNDGTTTTTDPKAAMRKSSLADGLPCYASTFTASDYADNTVVTCNFVAYPWVGDENSLRRSADGTAGTLDLGPLPLLADPDDDYGVTVAVVDPVNGTDGSVEVAADIADIATAEAAPCLTIRRALVKIAAYNNTNHSRNNANAGIIYLKGFCNTDAGTSTAVTTDDAWVTVTRHSTVTKANAGLQYGSASGSFSTNRLRLYDLTVTPTTAAVLSGNASRFLWCDSVDCPASSQMTSTVFSGHGMTFNTFCTADKVDFPFANYATANLSALIRGCTATAARGWTNNAIYSTKVLLTSSLTCNSNGGNALSLASDNTIAAYSAALKAGAGIPASDNLGNDTAIVGCLIEVCTSTGAELYSMANSNDPPHNFTNKLAWHCTFVGQRSLIGYNEDPTYPHAISQLSLKHCIIRQFNTKHDVFATDGSLTSAWSVLYGVGWRGLHDESPSESFPANWFGADYTGSGSGGFVDDQAFTYPTDATGASAGGGDYHLAVASPCRARIADAEHLLIPFDLEGSAFVVNGAIGAYATPPVSGGGYRFWTYS